MSVKKVSYCYVTVPNRVGQGEQVLGALKKAKVNLLAYTGFPVKNGGSQLDLVAKNITPIKRLTRQNGWRMSDVKKGFLVQGSDRIGAVHRHLKKLADQNINVTAADAVCAGQGRFGMLIWVKEKDYTRAARALKAK